MSKPLTTRNFVAAIEYLLNGMSTDQLTQLLDDITQYTNSKQCSTNHFVREKLPGLRFVATLAKSTIETRIISHND